MNKVFKVIWNHATQSWVAVSELQRAKGKTKSIATAAAATVALFGAADAMAAQATAYSGTSAAGTAVASDTKNVAVGDNAVTSSYQSTAVGTNATSNQNSVSMGYNATSYSGSVSVGSEAKSSASDSVAVGYLSNVTSGYSNSVAVGKNAVANQSSTVSIGANSQVHGSQSIAIGGGPSANQGANATGAQSIAIGGNVRASGDSSVAIGGDDVNGLAGRNATYTNYTSNTQETATVSTIYKNFTGYEIVNQGSNPDNSAVVAVTGNSDSTYRPTYSSDGAVALGAKSSATGVLSASLGTAASSTGLLATAVGTGAMASLQNSVAIGAGSNTLTEATPQTNTTVSGVRYSWAGGDKTVAGDQVSFGSAGYERQLKNVAAGAINATSTDAINGSQLYAIVDGLSKQNPVSYTDASGNPVVYDQATGNYYPQNSDGTVDTTTTVDPTTVKKSQGNLTGTLAKVGDTTSDSSAAAPTLTGTQLNGTASVADVLNAGWNLQADGAAKDFVKPYDTVNFAKGNGTTVNVTTNGTVTNVSFDVAVDGSTLEINSAGQVAAKTSTITNTAGKAVATTPTSLVNASTLADAINSASFNVIAGGNTGGTVASTAVKAGDTVTFKGGDNIRIDQNGSEFTIVSTTPVVTPATTTVSDSGDGSISIASTSTTDPSTGAVANSYQISVNKTDLVSDSDTGEVSVASGDENKVATVSSTATAINNAVAKSHWNLNTSGNATTEAINPNDTVTFKAGTGLDVTHVGTEVTYSLNATGNITTGNVSATAVDAGKVNATTITAGTNTTAPLTIGSDANGNNVISNLSTTLTPVADTATSSALPATFKDEQKTNAATVSDVLNAGWNLQNNSEAKDFVKAYDTVNFVKGTGTTAVVTSNGTVSNVTFNVVTDNSTIRVNSTTGNVEAVTEAIADGYDATTGNITAPTGEAAKALTTAGDVAEAINKAVSGSGWNLAAEGTSGNEKINPNDNVTFKAGEGLIVAREGANITYSLNPTGNLTTGNVSADTVTVGDATDAEGNALVKGTDGNYYPADAVVGKDADGNTVYYPAGTTLDANGLPTDSTVTALTPVSASDVNSPVTITKDGINGLDGVQTIKAADGTTLVKAADGNYYPADANGNADTTKTAVTPTELATTKNVGTQGLVDLDSADATSAATVADLQKMGWVVGTPANSYTDQVRNANQVDFIGTNGVKVTGDTNSTTGVREVTIAMDSSSTVDSLNVGTPKDENGNNLVKGADGNYYPAGTVLDATTGNPATATTPVITAAELASGDKTDSPISIGNVNGKNVISNLSNTLAEVDTDSANPTTSQAAPTTLTATEKSSAATVSDVLNAGWNLQENGTAKDFVKAYDTVNFVDGENTKVAVTTDGNVSNVAVNVELPISYSDANGNSLIKGADGNYYPAGSVKGKDANGNTVYYPAGTTLNADGTPTDSTVTALTPVDKSTVGAKLTTDPTSTAPTALTGVKGVETTTDKDGNSVITGEDGNTYPADAVKGKDASGNTVYYPAGTTLNADGTPTDSTVTALTGTSTTTTPVAKDGTVLVKTTDASGNTVYYPADAVVGKDASGNTVYYPAGTTVDATTGLPTDSTVTALTPTAASDVAEESPTLNNGKAGLVDLTNANPTNAATVADLQKMGWVVGTPANSYTDQVRNADQVDFVGENGITVEGKTVEGVRTIVVKSAVALASNAKSDDAKKAASATGDDALAMGGNSSASGKNSVALGNNAKANSANSVALGNDSVAGDAHTTDLSVNGVTPAGSTPAGVVSVGSVGAERQIQNVAAGRIAADSTDAVNGSQLHAVSTGLNSRIDSVNDKMNRMDKKLRAGIAGATAMSFLQRPNQAGKSLVSVAGGGYRGESAVAVGYSRNSDDNKVSIKLGVGVNSRGDASYGGSVGYQW